MTPTSHRDTAIVVESIYDITLGTWQDSMGEWRTISLEIDGANGLVDSCVNEKNLSGEHQKNKISTWWVVDQL
jgi:hypothetical protein